MSIGFIGQGKRRAEFDLLQAFENLYDRFVINWLIINATIFYVGVNDLVKEYNIRM